METTPELQWRALHGISVSRVLAPNGVHSLTLEPGSKGDFTGGIKEFAIFLDSLDGSSVICDLSGKKGSRKLREEGVRAAPGFPAQLPDSPLQPQTSEV